MENKRIIIIFVTMIILLIIISGISIATLTAYNQYEDDYIDLEISKDTKFKIDINNTTGLTYNSTKDNTNIKIYSLNTENNTLNNTTYDLAKEKILKDLNQYELNPSKHNYDGTVYKIKNTTTNNITYSILLFNDDKNSIILLKSDNIDSLIHMGETLILKKPFYIETEDVSTSNINTIVSKKSSDQPYTYPDGTRVIDGVIYTPEDGIIYELHPGEPGYEKEIKKYT
ncbi:hypothetical protein MARBORIA2_14980 [Methanobrevibacter arboriphilus]|jgi:lipopolysaccharide export LptBFGC system permease protein LptF|uniref:hypothetical protein n=1 Tax=Methanobrevibacter arboriphilus TaxID=39441 RepID=UPI0022ED6ECE|nr:hypothetical protein [Methanobrevibacter arboriphilus]GLI12408.1 hypothetical protein MARBORIA2_14980 [Methanobrevibacter arboriphilus]